MPLSMNVLRVLITGLWLAALTFAAQAADEPSADLDYYQIRYAQFNLVRSFGALSVVFEGEAAEKIGLDKKELTDLLRLKFKNNFANIGFKDRTKEFFEIVADTQLARSTGIATVTVWIVGADYPIAYHIKLDAGTFEKLEVYSDAMLGYGSKSNVPDSVRDGIAQLVERFAITFFKARGEL